jgi:hypothetical protein
MTLDEAGFCALVAETPLAGRPEGGWRVRPGPVLASPPGRPGVIEGERTVMAPDGRAVTHRANLGESPLAWLARRRDADDRPWLSPVEVAAGTRLQADAEMAQAGASVTMRWDALPRASGGSSARAEPGDRALAAGRRVALALGACPPDCRAFVEQVCVRGQGLQMAEQATGLRSRTGKHRLRRGLAALAAHYGMG